MERPAGRLIRWDDSRAWKVLRLYSGGNELSDCGLSGGRIDVERSRSGLRFTLALPPDLDVWLSRRTLGGPTGTSVDRRRIGQTTELPKVISYLHADSMNVRLTFVPEQSCDDPVGWFTVLAGPDERCRLSLAEGRNLIGCGADICLTDLFVTNVHLAAFCERVDGDWQHSLRHLGARVPAFLNGQVMEPEQNIVLATNDRVKLGQTTLVLEPDSGGIRRS